MANNEIILEMKNITKRFPGVLALDNVSLKAYKGEIHALCGENGAGKSTLMKILSGSYPASSYEGEIYVENQLQHFQTPKDSEEAGIEMIYQEISMHLDLTVAENIFIGNWPKKKNGIIAWDIMREEAKKYLNTLGVDIDPDSILRRLSASQQQLVAIARALSKKPKILVLDEPTSPLTNKESEKLFDVLKVLKESGIACILITHKMEEIFQNADRVTVLRDGKSVSSYLLSETNEKQIISDMVGREFDNFYPKEKVKIDEVIMEVKNLSVPHPSVPNRKIIDNISISLRKGEILGIAGLVGSGRSEMVNAIYGKQPKSSGDIFINGKKVIIKNPKDAIKNGMALITEDRKKDGIISDMSILENITLPSLKEVSKFGFIKKKKEKEISNFHFEKLKIKAPSINKMVGQLSGGNQQKVILARWMERKPKIFIMDEPTRGIDVGAKYEIYKIMMNLVKEGSSIIMISSELPELMSIADRIAVIADQQIKGILNADEFSQEKIMELASL